MLQNAYLIAKIGADTAENKRNLAKNLPKKSWQLPYPFAGASPPASAAEVGENAYCLYFTGEVLRFLLWSMVLTYAHLSLV